VSDDFDAIIDHSAAGGIEIFPLLGIGELRPGDDLAAAIVENAPPLFDGDVLVVTSKVISKVEGRLIELGSADPVAREAARLAAVTDETVRVVAERGPLRIVQTRHGFVIAAAGIDASNVALDELALLPVDPDASAAALRDALRARLGVDLGVVISDSAGRPWRTGIIDLAIGVAGLSAIYDARGRVDRHGNELVVTEVAVADELASAADLVKGKLGGIPVAVVRGLARDGKLVDNGLGASALIRGADEDMFSMGTAEAIAHGRALAAAVEPVSPELYYDAVAVVTAVVAPTPVEAALKHAFLGFLAARPDATSRTCVPGHLTASTMVVDPARRKLLLTLHPRVGAWLQVGGHCEPSDRRIIDTAIREATEESGLRAIEFDPVPLCLDVHPITCSLGVATRHFDVRYLATADSSADPVRSHESLDLAWFDWDALPTPVAADVVRSMQAVRARLGVE
jgi:coenzyme F420-0:L-glutamate ligase